MKTRIIALLIVLAGVYTGYFVYSSEVNLDSSFPFQYGLDLDGGTHLTYSADTSSILDSEVSNAMESLRQTIERRVNLFGVSEPIVQTEIGSIFGDGESDNRLIVELPGITDVTEAIDLIGKTPLLEFRIARSDAEAIAQIQEISLIEDKTEVAKKVSELYVPTGLTGGDLKRASLIFDNLTQEPQINIEFNSEGTKLFSEITRDNVGNVLAIFLDGQIISAPVIRQEIVGGNAQISGQFDLEEARDLVRDLNFGALPLPIHLIETQTIGASLGKATLESGVKALIAAFSIIFLFLIVWYRLPGLIASVSLLMYIVLMLAIFKLIPVVLTSSGLAGFILSLGMAVDANILIFERMKEEISKGNTLRNSIEEGFNRAWLSIRDGNLSSIISAVILFWLSGTSLVKGFALVFGVGVLVSMVTAVIISRTFLLAFSNDRSEGFLVKLFGTGFFKLKK